MDKYEKMVLERVAQADGGMSVSVVLDSSIPLPDALKRSTMLSLADQHLIEYTSPHRQWRVTEAGRAAREAEGV